MAISVVLVTMVSLLPVGLGLLAQRQVDTIKDYWYDRVQVSIFLCGEDSLTPTAPAARSRQAQKDALKAQLEQMKPLVKNVFYESEQQAYDRFKEQFRNSPLGRATSASATSRRLPRPADRPEKYDVVVSAFEGAPGVGRVQDQQKMLDKLFTVMNVHHHGLACARGVMMVLCAILLMATTIRQAAFSRRRETGIMKLVGASNFTIRLPFVMETVLATRSVRRRDRAPVGDRRYGCRRYLNKLLLDLAFIGVSDVWASRRGWPGRRGPGHRHLLGDALALPARLAASDRRCPRRSPKRLWFVLPMGPMSATPPRRALSTGMRLVTLGTALACAFTLMSPPMAATASDPRGRSAGRPQDRRAQGQLHETSADLAAAYIALRAPRPPLPAAQATLTAANAVLAKADQRNDEMAVALDVAQANEAARPRRRSPGPTPTSPTPARASPLRRPDVPGPGHGPAVRRPECHEPRRLRHRVAMADTVMSVQNQSLNQLSTVQAAATAQKATSRRCAATSPRQGRGRSALARRDQAARTRAAAAKVDLDRLAAKQARQPRSTARRPPSRPARRRAGRVRPLARCWPPGPGPPSRRGPARAAERAARAAAARRTGATPHHGAEHRRLPHRPDNAPVSSRVRDAVPPDPALLAPARRPRLRRQLWLAHPRRRRRHDHLRGWGGGYGNRIVVDHGVLRGVDLATTYNHLERYAGTVGTSPAARSSATSAPRGRRPAATCTSRPTRTAPPSTRGWL